MLRFLAIVVMLTACSSDESDKPKGDPRAAKKGGAGDTVHGAITVDGRELPVTGCEPKDGFDGIEVRLTTSEGVLVVADDLHWGKADSPLQGVEMDCSSGSKDYFGGKDEHGAYWKGTVSFDCKVMNHTIKGDLVISCGKIDPEMEAKWAERRKEMEQEARDFAKALAADGGVAPGADAAP